MKDISAKHHAFAVSLFKDPNLIMKTLTPERMDLLHAGIGASGEAGEILDTVKKCAIYDQPLDKENLIEELGDILFYLQVICKLAGIKFEDAMEHNMARLMKRYPNATYSDANAKERLDKA